MGWARTLLLGDIGNRLDIADAEGEIVRLRRELRESRAHESDQTARIETLEAETEELEILLAALIKMLVARGALAESDLAPFIEALEPQPEN